MGNVNAVWHKANIMPKNPGLEVRVKWHKEHAKNCQCREMPENIREIIKKRGGEK